jgi:hypothetical protein
VARGRRRMIQAGGYLVTRAARHTEKSDHHV